MYADINGNKTTNASKESDQNLEKGVRCNIKLGWWREGKTGIVLGLQNFMCNGQKWTPLLWDDEDDPTFCKTDSLVFTPNEKLTCVKG